MASRPDIIVLLHGYTQIGEKIKKRVADWIGKLNFKKYHVYAPDGKYEISPEDTSLGKGWWHLSSPKMFTKSHSYQPKLTIESELQDFKLLFAQIKKENEESNIYVLGFSQGAVMAELLMAHGCLDIFPSDKLHVMLVSPSGIMDISLKKPITHLPSTSIPIVIGEKEEIIGITPKVYTAATCLPAESYTFYSHPGGHYLPGKKDKDIILDWLSTDTKIMI